MANWNPRANEIFLSALEISVPRERGAFLDSACSGDQTLRQAVEALLLAHAEAGSYLDRPVGQMADAATAPPQPGDAGDAAGGETVGAVVAGRYKLLQQLGEGGMGTVWMAEQREPVKRMVALKVIKAGMDSAQVISRFEAERQALALMDHPNIAKVLDAGTTESGRPYFVMELVKGVAITKYCDERRLRPRARLALFIPVCQAVQHAHQKGIIHRDLKPSNVMIALYDGQPVPKVIDFGVAKATSQKLTEKTLFTAFGAIVGTLEYMSPEQAELNQIDIDTRCDIYSLGVVLYELLTGSTPLSGHRLKDAALLEMLRRIREEEPPRPSVRLSSSETLQALSAQRQTEPAKLSKLMRGELDWIVMKALEKDRDRRYESANGLAQDIERYLKDEPVLASPPSAVYRYRKFVKRNKGAVSAAAMLFMTLVIGIIGTTWGLVEAKDQRDDAVKARIEESEQRKKADKERLHAEAAKEIADKLRVAADGERNKADKLRVRAVGAEQEAKQRLLEAKETVFTFQVARAAGLWRSDPMQGEKLLGDEQACPPRARDFAWYFYHRLCQTRKAVFPSKAGKQTCVAFSPDGKLLAAGCNGGTIHLWDFASGKLLHHLKGQSKAPVQTLAFSRDGKTLFSGGDDKHVHRWDVADGKKNGASFAMAGNVQGIAVHPDGKWLAAGSYKLNPKEGNPDLRLVNGEVALWDLETGARKELLRDHKAGVLQVAISSDGKLVAAATTHDANVRVWDFATGKDYATFKGNNVGWVQGLAFSHNSKLLAFASADFKVRLWDVGKKTEIRTYAGHVHELWGVAFSPNDKLLASSSWDRTVRIWDVDSPWNVEHPKERLVLRDCEGEPVVFTPDGGGIIVQTGSTLVHHVLPVQEEYLTLNGHEDGIQSLAFSHDGKRLASISKDRSARLWNPHDGAMVHLGDYPDTPTCVAFSPDNQTVFVGATMQTSEKKNVGQIARWDVKAGKRLAPWLGHPSTVSALAVSAKHQLLVSGSDDVVKLWDLAAKEIAHLDLKGSPIQALAFHPTDKLLASLTGNLVTLWDVRDGTFKERKNFKRYEEVPPPPMGVMERPEPLVAMSLAFTSSGKYLVFNSPHEVIFYDLAKGQAMRVADLSAGTVAAWTVTKDEKTVAVGLEDRSIQLWDVSSKRLRATLTGHVRELSALAFSPDGKLLASGDQNRTFLSVVRGGTIKLWSAVPPRSIGQTPASPP